MKAVGNSMNPEKDFEIFKDDALGIVLFGSRARLEDVESLDMGRVVEALNGIDRLYRIAAKLTLVYESVSASGTSQPMREMRN